MSKGIMVMAASYTDSVERSTLSTVWDMGNLGSKLQQFHFPS